MISVTIDQSSSWSLKNYDTSDLAKTTVNQFLERKGEEGSEICNSITSFLAGKLNQKQKKGSEICNSITSFLAENLTPEPKKEVRSVILSLFLAGNPTPKPKGSEICL
jgi:hypothetical protein